MNLWKTLGLLIVFGLLLAYTLVYERGEAPDHEADRMVAELLGFKRAEDVTELTIEGSEGSFTLKRQPAKEGERPTLDNAVWDIAAPKQSKADESAVRSYVKTLLTTKAQRSYSAEDAKGKADSESGLDKPAGTLTLKAGGRTGTLLFGLETPNKNGYFARVKDGRGLLVFAQYFVDESILKKKLGDLRDKSLLAFSTTDVKKVTLNYPSRSLALEKRGEDWYLTGKAERKADNGTVDSLLSALTSARIDQFVEDKATDPAAYGLDSPRIEVILSLGDKGENGLLVGRSETEMAEPPADPNAPPPEPKEKLYVQRKGDDEVLKVEGSLYDSLLKNETDLRDKTVLAFQEADVTKLAYGLDGQDVELERVAEAKDSGTEPAQWKLLKPQALPADSRKVGDFLSTLNLLRATGFVDAPTDLGQYGLTTPRGRIQVTEKGKALPALLIGATDSTKGVLYVKREDAKTVLEVRSSFADDLETKPERLRDLLVQKLDRAKLKRIALRRKNGDLLVLQATGENEWELEKPEQKKADSGRVATVVSAVAEVRADEFVTDKASDLKQYGLDKPDVIATATLDDKTTHTLYVAQDPAGGLACYIKVKGRDAIYKSDHGLVLTDLQKKPEDFEPLPEPEMPPGMPPM